MRELLSGIWTWEKFSEPHGYNFNGYLIQAASGNLCIDPVPPDDKSLGDIERLGVAKILLTNRNHLRAANLIRERTGAKTLIHPEDAAHAQGQGGVLDGELREKQIVGPLIVIGVPGKSRGEVALHWPERRILFVGDAVIGQPTGHCGFLREQVIDDVIALRNSVRRLLDIDFDTLLFGDGEPILSGAKSRLAELVDSYRPRLDLAMQHAL